MNEEKKTDRKIIELSRLANRLKKEGKFEDAELKYNEVLENEPKNVYFSDLHIYIFFVLSII